MAFVIVTVQSVYVFNGDMTISGEKKEAKKQNKTENTDTTHLIGLLQVVQHIYSGCLFVYLLRISSSYVLA